MNQAKKSAEAIPFWRNVRVLHVLWQVAFVVLIVAFSWLFYTNLQRALTLKGLKFGFGFLREGAGFQISEGLPFQPTDSYIYALFVGVVNTLKVSAVGIVLATLLGTLMGIARLSSNWLISRIAMVYVEIVRNIPLLVQLLFWYFAVILQLPTVKKSLYVLGAHLSQRGLFLPWPQATEAFGMWRWMLLGALFVAVAVYVLRREQLKRADRPGFPSVWAVLSFFGVALLTWFFNSVPPLQLDFPELQKFNFVGGLKVTPEFAAILMGLVIYTGAFITEIVRAGIMAVSKGQSEAARALGLTVGQTLRLVVLPQALRVIVPPLASQYLNLTKNSSLAVVIGYYELTRVGNTIINQAGHGMELIIVMMGIYLAISLAVSTLMNLYNNRIRLVER